MAGSYSLQLAVYDKLDADATLSGLVVGIYDNPSQVDNPEDDSQFPFLTISTGNIQPWDTNRDKGADAQVEIHTWSRARHALEGKQIMDAVYNVLHRGTLDITGWSFVGMDMTDQQNPQRDPDGITRHGVQTFRVVYEEI